MRLVRLGEEPSEVGTDIRAAVSAWGEGCGVLGGVAVFGVDPPGGPRPLDAVIVLPRGIIVVCGSDLPQPALKVEAPLQTPWTVDSWPLVRSESTVNPGLEALESASALARSLQSRWVEPLPVGTVVVLGPYVEQVTQPTNDLHRGLRVVAPTTTAILAAARELATYEQACSAQAAQRVLGVLGEAPGRITTEQLRAEGFAEEHTQDLSSAQTLLISKIDESRTPLQKIAALTTSTRKRLAAISAGTLAACALLIFILNGGNAAKTETTDSHRAVSHVDGVEFVRKATNEDTECAKHSSGEITSWFEDQPCTTLSRSAFVTSLSGRDAAVTVSVAELPDEKSAAALRELLYQPGSGDINNLLAEGHGWPGAPEASEGSARTVEQTGNLIRVVHAAWANETSDPDDVALRTLAERGMRLP